MATSSPPKVPKLSNAKKSKIMKHMYQTPKTHQATLVRAVRILCASGEAPASQRLEVTSETANSVAAF